MSGIEYLRDLTTTELAALGPGRAGSVPNRPAQLIAAVTALATN